MSDWTEIFFFTPSCNLIWWSFNFSYRSSILSCSQWPLDGSEKPNPQRYQRPGSQSQCTGSGLPPRHEQHAPGARKLRGIGRSRKTAGVRAARQTVRLQDGDRTWQQAWWHSGASLEVNVTSAFSLSCPSTLRMVAVFPQSHHGICQYCQSTILVKDWKCIPLQLQSQILWAHVQLHNRNYRSEAQFSARKAGGTSTTPTIQHGCPVYQHWVSALHDTF